MEVVAVEIKKRNVATDDGIQEVLELCSGDSIAALRITLIANAMLECEIDRLNSLASSGFEQRAYKPTKVHH